MTVQRRPTDQHCQDCACWVKLSDQDGGLGICDNTASDHNQHLLGHWHPACSYFLDPASGLEEWSKPDGK